MAVTSGPQRSTDISRRSDSRTPPTGGLGGACEEVVGSILGSTASFAAVSGSEEGERGTKEGTEQLSKSRGSRGKKPGTVDPSHGKTGKKNILERARSWLLKHYKVPAANLKPADLDEIRTRIEVLEKKNETLENHLKRIETRAERSRPHDTG